MPLYHGTSRVFERFEAEMQDGGQLGSAFYFTDTRSVAENFAVFRHVPEVHMFNAEAELQAFEAEHRDWTLVYRDEAGGRILAQFNTPDSAPQVLTVELDVERPLTLDDPAPDAFLKAAQDAGIANPPSNTAQEVWDATLRHFHGRDVAPNDDVSDAHTRVLEVVRAAGYDAVTRPDNRNGVPHRTWIVFDRDKIVIIERQQI
jgi:hypothetical protein